MAPWAASQAIARADGSSEMIAEEQTNEAADAPLVRAPRSLTDSELVLLGHAIDTARRATVTELIRDRKYLSLHPQPVFRSLIKSLVVEQTLTVCRDDEPGTWIRVKGRITDASGQPITGAIVYVYHASDQGWYAENAAHIRGWQGDARHARLFGYLKTGRNGEFEIRTIKPGGDPESGYPRRIHIESEADGHAQLSTELLFDDDSRVTPEYRKRAQREGFHLAASESEPNREPTYWYHLAMRKA